LFAFLAMKPFGLTANLMSLGALDFGLIVDASVVMVENFVRKLRASPGASREEQIDIVRKAAFEVGRPILFGISIIIAVYIPIFALEGLEGRMFRPMAFTVCMAVLGSLILSMTYIPAVSTYLLTRAASPDPASAAERQESGWFTGLRERYKGVLSWALAHRGAVVGASLAAFAIALFSLTRLGTEFMPELDEGYLLIESRRIPSTSLEQGGSISGDLERRLKEFPEVKSVVTNLGRPHEPTETMALNQADVYLVLSPKREWQVASLEELIEKMDEALDEIPGVAFEFSAPMRMRLEEATSGVRSELAIQIYGDSLAFMQSRATDIVELVEGIEGAEDVSVGVGDGAMHLQIEADREALARYGLSVNDIREVVQSGVGGSEASEVIDGRRRYPIVVRLEHAYRSTPEAVEQTLIPTPSGGVVTLSQVARVTTVEGPETINHDNGLRFVVVRSNVRGRDLGSFAEEVQQRVSEEIDFPAGYFVSYGGQFENQTRAMARLALIVPAVLIAIAVLLYAGFGSMRHAVIVMLNVPFALVGGVAALWLRGLDLTLSAAVGFIALFGVAVLNGVVLITYVNQMRASGLPLHDAVREGASVRLRPVLMTALVASLGFVPMALSHGAGAEVQRPLATVVIGGLVSATLLTLVVLPTIYAWAEERWRA
jgi:cobalt-zinc-cadmium resistance protein CzcA